MSILSPPQAKTKSAAPAFLGENWGGVCVGAFRQQKTMVV